MTGADAEGSELAWIIPPHADPEASGGDRPSSAEVRELAEELEAACRPDGISVDTVPGGVSRIVLRFRDRDAAFEAFDAAAARTRATPRVACRVVASSPGPAE